MSMSTSSVLNIRYPDRVIARHRSTSGSLPEVSFVELEETIGRSGIGGVIDLCIFGKV